MTDPRTPRPPSTGRPVVLRRVGADDPVATAAVERYYDDLRALYPEGLDLGPASLDAGFFVVAHLADDPAGPAVGCGGLRPLDDPHTAEVKRLWVDPALRGQGLGGRLLRHLEAAALELGRPRVVLDTSDRLPGAIAVYRRSGYAEIAAYNDNPHARHWFEKRLDAR